MIKANPLLKPYLTTLGLLAIVIMVGWNLLLPIKIEESYNELKLMINQQFGNHDKIVDLLYYNKPVVSWNMEIPNMQSHKINDEYEKEYKDNWNRHYGDIVKLYRLDSNLTTSLDYDYDSCEDCWRIISAKPSDDGISISIIFPFGVGIREQESRFDYIFVPKIENIVNDGCDWLLQNPMSEMSRNFQKGKFKTLNDKLKGMETDFHSIQFLSNDRLNDFPKNTYRYIWNLELLDPQSYNKTLTVSNEEAKRLRKNKNVKITTKTNALGDDYTIIELPDPKIYPYEQILSKFYRLYIGTTNDISLSIYEKPDAVQRDFIETVIFWWTIGFFCISIIFYVIYKSRNAIKKSI